MGDHFVFLVGRLLTESTLESAIQNRNPKQLVQSTTEDVKTDCSYSEVAIMSPRKIVECRICQDEDLDSNMETPCSCCGSLKYAHRRCVQRWCNEKGDTVCEICNQPFKPGYTAPPPVFRLGSLPMNLRGNWGITRRDLSNPRLIAMVSSDENFFNPTYHHYSSTCCRSVAFIFMILLVLRHTLPIIVSRAGDYSFPLIMLLLLKTVGIVLPIYVILKVATSCLCHQQEQDNLSISHFDEEAGQ